MRKSLYLLLTAALMAVACSPTKVLTSHTEIVDSTITYLDTFYSSVLVPIPGDTVMIHDTIPCPGVEYKKTVKSKSGNLTATVQLHNSMLDVDCHSDSLLHQLDSLKTIIQTIRHTRSEKTAVPVLVNVPKPYIPKWVLVLMAANVLYVGWRFRGPISKLIKSFS